MRFAVNEPAPRPVARRGAGGAYRRPERAAAGRVRLRPGRPGLPARPGDLLGNVPDGAPGGLLGNVLDGVSGDLPDGAPGGLPGNVLDGVPGDLPDGVPDGLLGNALDGLSGDVAVGVPGDRLGAFTERLLVGHACRRPARRGLGRWLRAARTPAGSAGDAERRALPGSRARALTASRR